MNRWIELRTLVIAVAFLAIGFLVAERMTPASAAPVQKAGNSDTGASFAGTTGALAVGGEAGYLIIVRDRKVYRLPLGKGGDNNNAVPWANLND